MVTLRAGLRTASAILLGFSLFAVGTDSYDSGRAVQSISGQCADGCAVQAYTCYAPGSRIPFRREEFTVSGTNWPQQNGPGTPLIVTYSFSNLLDGSITGLTPEQLVAAVEESLSLWATVSPIHFIEVPDVGLLPTAQYDAYYDGKASAHIRYGRHTIDGKGKVAAHAYYPMGSTSIGLAGDVHFDIAENWSTNAGGLFLEACLHETGHALGLAHESSTNAIMNPSLKKRFGGLGNGFLLNDDIAGIQSVYGAGVGSVTPLDAPLNVPAPLLIAPEGMVSNPQPTFSWQPVAGATSYQIQVEDTGTGSLVANANGLTSCSFVPASALTRGRTYDWHVRAATNGTTGNWSELLVFQVENATPPPQPQPQPSPDIPVLISPIGTINTASPTFEWLPAAGTFKSHIKVMDLSTGRAVVNFKTLATTFTANDLTVGGQYTWQVRAMYADRSFGPWSESESFVVSGIDTAPVATIPEPLYPIGETRNVHPSYEWTAVDGAVGYHLYVEVAGTGQRKFEAETVSNEFVRWRKLNVGETYAWEVRAIFSDGSYGEWSDSVMFTVK